MEYYVYVIQCSDKSLYTGIAVDLEKRLQAHRNKKGSKYVATRLPFILVYSEKHRNRSSASKREYEIKSWTREEKIQKLNLV